MSLLDWILRQIDNVCKIAKTLYDFIDTNSGVISGTRSVKGEHAAFQIRACRD